MFKGDGVGLQAVFMAYQIKIHVLGCDGICIKVRVWLVDQKSKNSKN